MASPRKLGKKVPLLNYQEIRKPRNSKVIGAPINRNKAKIYIYSTVLHKKE